MLVNIKSGWGDIYKFIILFSFYVYLKIFVIQVCLSTHRGLVPGHRGYQNLQMFKSLIQNDVALTYNLYLHTGCSKVCLHITSFLWIQHSAQGMANSSFTIWNFLGFLFSLNIFNLQLDATPVDTKGQL